MARILVLTAWLSAAIGVLWASVHWPPLASEPLRQAWAFTAGSVILLAGLLGVATMYSRPGLSRATLRLDWFLPFLRKERAKFPYSVPRPWQAFATRWLPTGWLSDASGGRAGRLRRGLKWVGVSWLSAPWRRASQTAFFLLFVWLFLYVCWPYTAHPPRSWTGWTPVEFDVESGQITLQRDSEESLAGLPSYLHLVDEAELEPAYVGRFRVRTGADGGLFVWADPPLSAEAAESLSFSFGPWSLYETPPGEWPDHYTRDLEAKEFVPAETLLVIDPLVSISTSIAARSWVWSLFSAAIILTVCLLIPRGFCGYICPLGTLIDLFDWAIGRRVTRFRVPDDGWWVHIKYYLLAGSLVAAAMGVLVTGYVAAIPVITRGFMFLLEPLQSGLLREWHLVTPIYFAHILSVCLFFGVLALGLLKPRFWCKYVCPSGAVFSLGNLLRWTERKVETSCINCNKCVEVCPFDAIKPDFTTRTTDCTLCQTCGGVCPTHAIKFVDRWSFVDLKTPNDPPTHETPIGRRGFIAAAAGGAAALAGGTGAAAATKWWGANLDQENAFRPVRPPGSVPEQEFLQLCIRCGECFKACPNNVLQIVGFEQGWEGLWTPQVAADWAGCESSCNACTQVCPTGAIRPLPLEEKRHARMGLAIVNQETCLPIAGREACQLCVDECNAAGYEAIEFVQVHTEVDEQGEPIPDTGFLAPEVLADKCVGCGLCQTRCFAINVQEGKLDASAIIIEAGGDREDRLIAGRAPFPRNSETGFDGSYVQLRRDERLSADADQSEGAADYLPDFLREN